MPLKLDDARVWFNLGVAYAKRGHLAEAVSAYREAVAVRPDFPEAWYNLGIACGNQRHYDEAIGAFREAVRLWPDYVKAWFNLGVAYAVQGNRDRVLEVHEQLKSLDSAKAAEFLGALGQAE